MKARFLILGTRDDMSSVLFAFETYSEAENFCIGYQGDCEKLEIKMVWVNTLLCDYSFDGKLLCKRSV